MDNQIVRLFILVVLVLLLTSDIKDLLEILSTTSTVGPYLSNWKNGVRGERSSTHHIAQKQKADNNNKTPYRRRKLSTRSVQDRILEDPEEDNMDVEFDNPDLKFYTPIPTGRKKNSIKPKKSQRVNPDNLYGSLTDEEKQELLTIKSYLTKVMQEWCLPKLVCELHATIRERENLSEAEKGLLSIIKETSLNPMGDVISKYHFAAHMGQLLADVEGNGCHNFYPNCPLSGTKVLQMVKKVRIS